MSNSASPAHQTAFSANKRLDFGNLTHVKNIYTFWTFPSLCLNSKTHVLSVFHVSLFHTPIGPMESWLSNSGAAGLEDVEVADFPTTGRGVRAHRAFKQDERILTIPASCLWTVKHAYDDSLLGPVLRSAQPSLSVETHWLCIFCLCGHARKTPRTKDYKAILPCCLLATL